MHDVVVEPFAGSAGYAHRYHRRNVILIERDPIVAELWRWLISSTSADVLDLPLLEPGQDVRSIGLPRPAESLLGFWCNPGTESPRRSLTSWALAKPDSIAYWSAACRQCIASNIHNTDHWTIIEGDYREAPSIEATWFIDPPYSSAVGRLYRKSDIDYSELSDWCTSRDGQTIVCETEGADWLQFEHHASAAGQERVTNEVVWMNRRVQQRLF